MGLVSLLALALGGVSPVVGEPPDQAPPRLEVEDHVECGVSDGALWGRVEARTMSLPRERVHALAYLATHPAGVEVTVHLRSSTRLLGARSLVVPTCQEAEDAVVTIVALALSQVDAPEEPLESRPPMESDETPAIEPSTTVVPGRDKAPSDPRSENRVPTWVALGEMGADVSFGTWAATRVSWGAGARHSWGLNSISLGGQLLQPLHLVDADSREQTTPATAFSRVETFGLNSGYCRSTRAAPWLDLCGGLQANFWRIAFSDRDGASSGTEVRHALSLDSVFGIHLSGRWGIWEPHARLATRLPLTGHPEGHSGPAALGSVGVGVAF